MRFSDTSVTRPLRPRRRWRRAAATERKTKCRRWSCSFWSRWLLFFLCTQVGPSGSHFGLLACLCVEVLHAWPLLRTPWRALGRLLLMVALLFVAGTLPWVDNFAHIFGYGLFFLSFFLTGPLVEEVIEQCVPRFGRKRKADQDWLVP